MREELKEAKLFLIKQVSGHLSEELEVGRMKRSESAGERLIRE